MGFHDQSYFGKHSLTQWGNYQRNKPISILDHIDVLISLIKKSNINLFKSKFEKAFLIPNMGDDSLSGINTTNPSLHNLTIRFLFVPVIPHVVNYQVSNLLSSCAQEENKIKINALNNEEIKFNYDEFDETSMTIVNKSGVISYKEIYDAINSIK
jgi:hypothetical protein